MNSNAILLPFAKMQALGNDFIVLDGEALLLSEWGVLLLKQWSSYRVSLAQNLCARRLGIGGDGLILALNLKRQELAHLAAGLYGTIPENCQLAWTITNSDGSSPETCGNGLRCLALWAHQKELIIDQCRVMTAVGVVAINYHSADSITVDLGEPKLLAEKIPFTGVLPGQNVVNYRLNVGTSDFPITGVNMGNPHCVTFSQELLDINLPYLNDKELNQFPPRLLSIAQQIQADGRFSEGANISFAQADGRAAAKALVVERGCGPTLACGSAAAAILVAGVLEGRLHRQSKITLPGGTLLVEWSEADNHVRISGGARFSFHGEIKAKLDSFGPSSNMAKVLRANSR